MIITKEDIKEAKRRDLDIEYLVFSSFRQCLNDYLDKYGDDCLIDFVESHRLRDMCLTIEPVEKGAEILLRNFEGELNVDNLRGKVIIGDFKTVLIGLERFLTNALDKTSED